MNTTKDKINSILNELPDYCQDFISSKAGRLSDISQMNYLGDLQSFFLWLNADKKFSSIKSIPIGYFDTLTSEDIKAYLDYLSEYKNSNGTVRKNGNSAKARKLSSIRTLYKYLNRNGLAKNNPTEDIRNPKPTPRKSPTLDIDNLMAIMQAIDTGSGHSEKLEGMQLAFSQRQKSRNKAIIALMIDTGIHTPEISNLDISDIELDNRCVIVKDKAAYYTETTKEAIAMYLKDRETLYSIPETENALFISKKNKRMSVRSIQYMIQFYKDLAISSRSK